MSVVRLLLLLVILAGLAGLVLQNLSPSVPLVFLGARSQPLPLAFLIFGAVTAGVITGLTILGLVSLGNYWSQRQLRSRLRDPEDTPQRQQTQTGDQRPKSDPRYNQGTRSYEADPKPRTGEQSGSAYSYSYQNSSQSGVGRRESVFDAEYREVTPPSQPEDLEDLEDDWFEDDSDDWDWEDTPKSRR